MTQALEKTYCQDCNTAKKKFRKGDLVILSVSGCNQLSGLIQKNSVGKVVGFGRNYNLVRILTRNRKRPESYHCGYWERFK